MKKYHSTFQADQVHASAFIAAGAVVVGAVTLAAGALVTQRQSFPDHSLILGSPARVIREVTAEELRMMQKTARQYVEKARAFRQQASAAGSRQARLSCSSSSPW